MTLRKILIFCACFFFNFALATELRGTGDLGVIVERSSGELLLVEHTNNKTLGEIHGLGDLSHASVVFSRDARYAFVFGRDGGLTKVDLLTSTVIRRIIQSGNSIGGAISSNGKVVAVSNYEPGGVKLFNSETLELITEIPATYDEGKTSKTVGLVDAPGNQFVFSLYEGNQIWLVDANDPKHPIITKFQDIGKAPYDGLITPNGRFYIAGLFAEDSMALLDLWHPERGVREILKGYLAHDEKLPVYKMPHLEGWAMAGNKAFVPAVGQHKVIIMDTQTWTQSGEIKVHGQPVFVMARPDERQVWVNFAFPDNNTIQVIDTESLQIIKTLTPGKGILHMEFTPRGENIWLSIRDENKVHVYNTSNFKQLKQLSAKKPSGIFFTNRAHEIGL